MLEGARCVRTDTEIVIPVLKSTYMGELEVAELERNRSGGFHRPMVTITNYPEDPKWTLNKAIGTGAFTLSWRLKALRMLRADKLEQNSLKTLARALAL